MLETNGDNFGILGFFSDREPTSLASRFESRGSLSAKVDDPKKDQRRRALSKSDDLYQSGQSLSQARRSRAKADDLKAGSGRSCLKL